MARGVDPFDYDYPVVGFPNAAEVQRPVRNVLTDAFLLDVAQRYVDLGRGYAEAIAAERGVSPRTVVSWIEKARQRGLLSPTRPGVPGGEVIGGDGAVDVETVMGAAGGPSSAVINDQRPEDG